ncbi:receptor-transporting protein 3-like [Tubulanus polymorphus]|uniref:receptor-transporting protein 3-like n=1 Tax=Tubulanus polymorphus TaxID=672921 RepID=UPI003DA410F9
MEGTTMILVPHTQGNMPDMSPAAAAAAAASWRPIAADPNAFVSWVDCRMLPQTQATFFPPSTPVDAAVLPAGLTTSYQQVPPQDNSTSLRMELVWHNEFSRLFGNFFMHQWALYPSFQQPLGKWKMFQDSAKVRFICQKCMKGWTSMKGRVVYWFNLDPCTGFGIVYFKLFGQQCKDCMSGFFEPALWYPEEVLKVVANLYYKVGQTYYGFQKPPIRTDRRSGKPKKEHDRSLCQACFDGICRESNSNGNSSNPINPATPTVAGQEE